MSYPRIKRRKDRQAFADYARLNGDLDALAEYYRVHPNPPMLGLVTLARASRRLDFCGRLAEARQAQPATVAAQPALPQAVAAPSLPALPPPTPDLTEGQGISLMMQELASLLRQTTLRLASSEDPAMLGILPRVAAQLRALLCDLLQEKPGRDADDNPTARLESVIQVMRLSASSEDDLQTMRALLAAAPTPSHSRPNGEA